MSLHGNFERLDDGFEFRKGEFGKGKFRLQTSSGKVMIQDGDEVLAAADLEVEKGQEIRSLQYALLSQLEECESGELFLEVVGGSDYLKDFLDKMFN
ncbi:MAG: hypothetical protein ABEJ87_05680 [Candidatus Nanohalobium sp.]